MSVTQQNILEQFDDRSLWQRLVWRDWVWALLVLAGAGYAYVHYVELMDGYEVAILAGTALSLIGLGWAWKPMQPLSLMVTVLSLGAIALYGTSLATAESNFFLKYLISSQSAIMWMSALYVLATATYFMALFARSDYTAKVASALTWSATTMGLVGLMVRWRESYLISADVGHIPVSNLYEVFILFSIITALLYLYYEGRYHTRALGGFVLLVISAAVGFLLWYTFDREAHTIQPLVP
ncbi:MAG: c-type cytochrome biogenesis protein CcsB, partial [Gammaproteobacteria bacterium]|nr:c-type cytochrome biogenesis protein CcsB [Gammaproteobacteria bacterium]